MQVMSMIIDINCRFGLLFQFTLALALFAQLASAADNAIGSSSDVWAALVANIAPLLILLGEKHVKAYFKVMCRPSHYLLYAAGPIGLITAITTLIRLNGTRVLKRLIGRQFETRAEVLADVTSVSSGDVCFQLDEAAGLEQTILIDKSKKAFFYLQAEKECAANNGDGELMDWWARFTEEVTGRESTVKYSKKNNLPFWFTVFASFGLTESEGGASEPIYKTTRTAAMKFAQERFSSRTVQPQTQSRTCSASAKAYVGWGHVSLPLTASVNYETWKTETLKLAIVVGCLAGNIGIIAANWTQQEDIQNTVLVTLGLTISTGGTYFVARLVDKGTHKEVINLDRMGMSVSRVGFFSKAYLAGLELSFIPKKIITSEDTDKQYPQSIVAVVVVVMTMGYIALYLGLRTSEWWASLSLLALSGIASLGRALLVNDGMVELSYFNESSTNTPFWDFDLESLGSRNAHSRPRSSQRSIQSAASGSGGSTVILPAANSPSTATKKSEKTILRPEITHSYETLAIQHGQSFFLGPQARNSKVRGMRWSEFVPSIYLAMHLRKHNVIPIELSSSDLVIPVPDDPSGRRRMAIIYSDLICNDGIWRQPLETLIELRQADNDAVDLERFVMYVSCWFQRSRALRREFYKAKYTSPTAGGTRIVTHPLWTRASTRISFPRFSDFTRKGPGPIKIPEHHKWENGEYVWTAAKIVYVCLKRYSLEELKRLANDYEGWARVWYQIDGVSELDEWVGYLKLSGLVVPSEQGIPEVAQKSRMRGGQKGGKVNPQASGATNNTIEPSIGSSIV